MRSSAQLEARKGLIRGALFGDAGFVLERDELVLLFAK